MGEWKDNYKRYDPATEGYGNPKEWKRTFNRRLNPDEANQILQDDDPYFILGVPNPSTKKVIKKAYYDMAMKWHPDKNPDNIDQATEMMKKINAAYSILY